MHTNDVILVLAELLTHRLEIAYKEANFINRSHFFDTLERINLLVLLVVHLSTSKEVSILYFLFMQFRYNFIFLLRFIYAGIPSLQMEIYVRLSDSATYVSISLMEANKKYVVVHARRFQNTSHPIIKLTIQYSEHEMLDIFLPWRFSDPFTPRL
jgi:hypothetical protein